LERAFAGGEKCVPVCVRMGKTMHKKNENSGLEMVGKKKIIKGMKITFQFHVKNIVVENDAIVSSKLFFFDNIINIIKYCIVSI
jgi:hypothetical protein